MIVHYCDWAAQGDIHIFCSQEWSEAGWDEIPNLPPDIYSANNMYSYLIYTFDKTKVTCEKCHDMLMIRDIIE